MDERLPLLIGLACLLFVLLAAPAHAGERWTRSAVVSDVAVTVTVVTLEELARLSPRELGGPARLANPRPVHGFAKLYRNTETGAFRCDVFVPEHAPAETLEHELRHCHGWVHL